MVVDLTPQYPSISAKEKLVIPEQVSSNMAQTSGSFNVSPDGFIFDKLKILSTQQQILIGDATASLTGIGIFQGLENSIYQWRVGNPDGDYIYWNNTSLIVKGTLTASSINIPDVITANSFHTDSSGNSWWGSVLIGDAVAKVLNTGAGTFSNITITGGTIGGQTVDNIGYVATSTADAVPSGLTCSSTGISTGSDGSQSAYVILTWTAISTNTFSEYLIRYKKASFTYYTYIPAKTNTITIEGLTPNISYNFGIASVNKYGQQSAFSADISQTTASDTVAPATVTGVTAVGAIQYALIEWTASSASDLSHYNVYRNTVNDSATATKIASVKTTYFIDGNLTA